MTGPRRRPTLPSVFVVVFALVLALWQASPAFASTVTVLGTNAPGGSTFTFTAGPGIPPTFGGVVNSTVYILSPGTYTVVWNPVSGCTITPTSATFTVTSSSTNVIDAPTAVYTCASSIPPDTSITAQPPNPANSSSASFSFTGTDNITAAADLTFQCALDGAAFAACTSPQSYTGLADGSHTFEVRARDGDNNVDPTPASYTWVIQTDAVAPDTTITAQPADPTNQTSASFAFSGADNIGVTGFECQLDGGGFAACTSPKTYSGLSQGDHTFQVRAKDAAGNVDASPASYTWTVDTTAPVVTVPANITAEATGAAGAVVTFTASATDANPAALTPTCAPPSGSTFAIGTTTVTCSATDAAGNIGTTSFTITVRDTTAPTLSLPGNQTAEATSAAGAVVTYTATATDLVAGSLTPTCAPLSGSTFAIGTTTVTCSASDAAGNSGSASFTVTVRDTTVPTLTVPGGIAVNATSPAGAAVSFTVSATDAVTASPTISCTASGATTGAVSSGATFAIGTTTVSCTAKDGANNTSAAKTFTVTVKSATTQVTDLLTTVQALPVDPATRNNLISIVQNAQAAIGRGDIAGACDKLSSFISQVRAQSDKKIVKATADGLIADAQRIRAVLGCA